MKPIATAITHLTTPSALKTFQILASHSFSLSSKADGLLI
jgi:hypothetical protein